VYLESINPQKIDPNINTEFVELKNAHEISVRVFERGVGETMACGTGACASVAWLVQNKHLKENEEIRVHLNGGSLYVSARQTSKGLRMQMKGPARMVFKGEV
jgi:diaminopimelate epimerase